MSALEALAAAVKLLIVKLGLKPGPKVEPQKVKHRQGPELP